LSAFEKGRPLPVPELADASLPSVIPASLHVTLAFGQDFVAADFSGMRPLPTAPTVYTPFHWTPAPEQYPTLAIAPVFLGIGEGGCLFVDLALAPGMVTVTGHQRVRAELGAELVNRLGVAVREGARRFAVAVAGTPFDPDLLAVDPIRVGAPSEFDVAKLPATAEVCFLACCLSTPAEAQVISALARSAGPRIVPLLVDDVAAADWSLHGR
jgi:hypothetical protein